jgi:transcriptional regulator with XRE-family HTH domain
LAALVKLAPMLGREPVFLVTGVHGNADWEFVEAEAKLRYVTESEIVLADFITADPTSIGARLRATRVSRKLSLEALGNVVGKTRQGIQHWEVGKSEGSLQDLLEVAKYLNCDFLWLTMGLESRLNEDHADIMDGQHPLRSILVRPANDIVEPIILKRRPKLQGQVLPLYDDVETNPDRTEAYFKETPKPVRLIMACFPCSRSSFAFTVKSTRNEPHIKKGDIVVIDPLEQFDNDQLVLARIRNQVELGRLEIDKGNAALLALNSEHSTIALGKAKKLMTRENLTLMDRRNVPHIIGVVAELTKRFG